MVRMRVTRVREAGEREPGGGRRGRGTRGTGAGDAVVDRSQVATQDVHDDRPYDRRNVRPRVTPPPGVEERLAQVESDVAVVRVDLASVRGDVQWIAEAIMAIHSGVPLPSRDGAAPPSP
ncbi:hypothetical protein Hanom_Chr12g01125341 [Helianthus anomalus]